MPKRQLVPIGPRAAGTHITPWISLATIWDYAVRITQGPQAEFDSPTLRMTITLEFSPDDGTTILPLKVSGNYVGGARGKDGGLPSIAVASVVGADLGAAGMMVRGVFTLNQSARLGLDEETLVI